MEKVQLLFETIISSIITFIYIDNIYVPRRAMNLGDIYYYIEVESKIL